MLLDLGKVSTPDAASDESAAAAMTRGQNHWEKRPPPHMRSERAASLNLSNAHDTNAAMIYGA